MVRTVKDIFIKATDPFLALLTYRNNPGVSGYTPAQLLMGRALRTRVKLKSQGSRYIIPERLSPDCPQIRGFDETDQAHDFNNRHRAEDLRPLLDGEEVWVTNVR